MTFLPLLTQDFSTEILIQRRISKGDNNPEHRNDKVRLCLSDSLAKKSSDGLNELGFVYLTDNPAPIALAKFEMPADTVMLSELGRGMTSKLTV